MENKEQHFSWYSNVYSIREEKRMTLIQIYELIKSGKLRFITKEIRRLTAEGRHKEARRMKMQLPAFVVAALSRKNGRRNRPDDTPAMCWWTWTG